jgi:hypothetical protein
VRRLRRFHLQKRRVKRHAQQLKKILGLRDGMMMMMMIKRRRRRRMMRRMRMMMRMMMIMMIMMMKMTMDDDDGDDPSPLPDGADVRKLVQVDGDFRRKMGHFRVRMNRIFWKKVAESKVPAIAPARSVPIPRKTAGIVSSKCRRMACPRSYFNVELSLGGR